MNFFHLHCRIISKSNGSSSVAASAYVSADKLVNERTGLIHDFTDKHDVIFNDTVLCDNAPAIYKNRETLWNAVEKIEKASDARFARRMDLAIPNDFSKEQAIELFYDVASIFTKEGMCFDGGIHWQEGNHHFDFLLTTRPINKDETWGNKERKEYVFLLDKFGNKIIDKNNPNWWEDKNNPERCGIRIPDMDSNGLQKTDEKGGKIWKRERVDCTGWDRKETLEHWRAECCRVINQKAIKYGYGFKIDHRSYEKQNLDIVPTIHEGYTARKIESEGSISDRILINRKIRDQNNLRKRIKSISQEITKTIIMKARQLYERIRGIEGCFSNSQKAGGNGIYSGEPAERNCLLEEGIEKINKLKRTAEQTEFNINKTNRRIEELVLLKRQKEVDIFERFERLKSRRATEYDGGDARRNREASGREQSTSELNSTITEIGSFIADIDSREQNITATAKIRSSRFKI